MNKLLGGLGVLGCLAWIIVAFLFNVVIILLVWNDSGLALHTVFHAGQLTFWQAVIVAVILSLIGV